MTEQNKDYLKWDYDYKEKLLDGNKYERDQKYAIKNILKAQLRKNYVKNHTGHIENYDDINKIFKTVFHLNDNELEHKDVMNSFWHTYKFYLQLEYPEEFLNKYSRVSVRKKPFKSCESIENSLLEFDKFPKVHNNINLQKFAKLTHTIGNITVVPKGFNARRKNYDYWDYGLRYLKKSWYSTNSEWKKSFKIIYLKSMYVIHVVVFCHYGRTSLNQEIYYQKILVK